MKQKTTTGQKIKTSWKIREI